MEANDRLLRLKAAFDWLKSQGVVATYTDVAKILQQPISSISMVFKGSPRYLTNKFLHRFAGAFPVNEEWLVNGEGEMLDFSRTLKNIGYRKLPLIDLNVSFTGWDYLFNDPIPVSFTDKNTLYYVLFPHSEDRDFAIEIDDEDNYPVIPPETILHLRQSDLEKILSSGDLAVFQMRGDKTYQYKLGVARLKKLQDTEQELVEISYKNPKKTAEFFPVSVIKRCWKVINYMVYKP